VVFLILFFFFFFQAEDGIRDGHVTGVQTCALPIWPFTTATTSSRGTSIFATRRSAGGFISPGSTPSSSATPPRKRAIPRTSRRRSEERRVGKEWRSRWWEDQ